MRPILTERRMDRLATVLIRTGGLLVILVVVGIVINIGSEAVPLFRRAAQGPVFFKDMAVVIMFGLGFASVLTLVVVTVLYAIFFKVKTNEQVV